MFNDQREIIPSYKIETKQKVYQYMLIELTAALN